MKANYPAGRSVSIWVGTFRSEDVFDLTVDREVGARLKLPTSLASICETAFEDEVIPTRSLLEGFSGWESFIVDASAACEEKATTANAALVCYNLLVSDAPGSWGDLIFLGTFAGADIA